MQCAVLQTVTDRLDISRADLYTVRSTGDHRLSENLTSTARVYSWNSNSITLYYYQECL